MEKVISGISLTSNDEMDSFLPGDNSILVTGVIVRLDPPYKRRSLKFDSSTTKTDKNDKTPFRCILSNMSGRFIRILFWSPRKQEFEGSVLKQIIRISRTHVLLANAMYNKGREDLMEIELSVQKHTVVELLGPMPTEEEEIMYEETEFKNIGSSVGKLISIEGYVRTPIEQIISNNATYGSGAITDFHYRIPVNVTQYDSNSTVPLGAHVRVKGRLRVNEYNTIIFQVPNREHILILGDKYLSHMEMKLRFHVLKPKNIEMNDLSEENGNLMLRKKSSHSPDNTRIPSKISKNNDNAAVTDEDKEDINFDLFL
ncbi:uncharacterized protein LOC127277671 [Leptopilina boulardi]|uniref:uncharacterized protein LOC127277671 n=1 Tax=Leptopilina boulardi TaxID=63433 RepID=UPI0021F547C9|nr:uncharacterized protein LOC127277671 [Leptopilina boulardi]